MGKIKNTDYDVTFLKEGSGFEPAVGPIQKVYLQCRNFGRTFLKRYILESAPGNWVRGLSKKYLKKKEKTPSKKREIKIDLPVITEEGLEGSSFNGKKKEENLEGLYEHDSVDNIYRRRITISHDM